MSAASPPPRACHPRFSNAAKSPWIAPHEDPSEGARIQPQHNAGAWPTLFFDVDAKGDYVLGASDCLLPLDCRSGPASLPRETFELLRREYDGIRPRRAQAHRPNFTLSASFRPGCAQSHRLSPDMRLTRALVGGVSIRRRVLSPCFPQCLSKETEPKS